MKMQEDLNLWYKLIGLAGGIIGIASIPFRLVWGKLSKHDQILENHRNMLEDRYTKGETKEVVSWSLEPLAKTAENLEATSKHLLEVVRELELKQARQEGDR